MFEGEKTIIVWVWDMIQIETVSVGIESHAFHRGGKPAPAERHSCRCFLNSSLTNNNSSLLSELK